MIAECDSLARVNAQPVSILDQPHDDLSWDAEIQQARALLDAAAAHAASLNPGAPPGLAKDLRFLPMVVAAQNARHPGLNAIVLADIAALERLLTDPGGFGDHVVATLGVASDAIHQQVLDIRRWPVDGASRATTILAFDGSPMTPIRPLPPGFKIVGDCVERYRSLCRTLPFLRVAVIEMNIMQAETGCINVAGLMIPKIANYAAQNIVLHERLRNGAPIHPDATPIAAYPSTASVQVAYGPSFLPGRLLKNVQSHSTRLGMERRAGLATEIVNKKGENWAARQARVFQPVIRRGVVKQQNPTLDQGRLKMLHRAIAHQTARLSALEAIAASDGSDATVLSGGDISPRSLGSPRAFEIPAAP